MGGGYNSGGPDRSDEYEDRRPDEEERAEAQETVREAVERAERAAEGQHPTESEEPESDEESEPESDESERTASPTGEETSGIDEGAADGAIVVDGESFANANEAARHLEPTDEQAIDVDLGSTDPGAIEAEFGVDLSETEIEDDLKNSETNTPYPTFTYGEANQVRTALEEKHGEAPTEAVYDLMSDWKGSSGGEEGQTLSLIAKKALGIAAPVRGNGEQARTIEPDDAEIDVYRDLTRVSRGFMREHMARDGDGEVRALLHRGVRHSNEELTAQLIDDPTVEEYRFPTVAISNHSVDRGVGNYWAEAYSISHAATPEDVGLAIDVVQPTGFAEGEIHVTGDEIRVPAEGLTWTGPSYEDNEPRNAPELFAALDTPSEGTQDDHEELLGLVRSMDREGVTPSTEAGVERLVQWAVACSENRLLRGTKSRRAQRTVKSILDNMEGKVELDHDLDDW